MVASVLYSPRRESIYQASKIRKRLALWYTYVDGRLSSYATIGDAKEALLYNWHNSPRTFHETTERVPGGERASDFFSQGLRQHVLVEGEIGNQPFQPVFSSSTWRRRRSSLMPRCAYFFSTRRRWLTELGARLRLTQCVDHLLFGKSRPLHRAAPFVRDRRSL